MHDQLFTAENFRRIFDIENRRGNNLASRFFPELEPFTLAVREAVQQLRSSRENPDALSESDHLTRLIDLKRVLREKKDEKSTKIDELMERVSESIRGATFKIGLKKADVAGKPAFSIDETAEAYFTMKQLQHNLRRVYRVKQSSRHAIVCQVRDALRSRYQYDIVRSDVSAFYESIDRDQLLMQLESDQRLGATTKRLIRQLMSSYEQLTSSVKGIPRGVGVSAYLAELYMQPVDAMLQRTSGVVIYCRYVDDIVMIVSRPPAIGGYPDYLSLIGSELSKVGLSINPGKSAVLESWSPDGFRFEYLGYHFSKAPKKSPDLVLRPSGKKIKKLKRRLVHSFALYGVERHRNPRRAHRILVARVKFLTGNFRLINSKSSAALGTFYSNSLATNVDSLAALDKRLKRLTASTHSKVLKARLKRLSFTRGFKERVFHNFNTQELRRIVEAWSHE